jgi:hypothetical protein
VVVVEMGAIVPQPAQTAEVVAEGHMAVPVALVQQDKGLVAV